MKPYILGRTRLRILAAIMDAKGVPPTVRELMAENGIASPNGIAGHLNCLRRDGMIRSEPHQARTYTATCRFIPAEEL